MPIFYANVNPKKNSRTTLLSHLQDKYSLNKIRLDHPTYHHFLGNGEFDSPLDIILDSSSQQSPAISEIVTEIICKNQNPLVQSHHDIIISKFSLLPANNLTVGVSNPAPKILNDRVKILWTEDGISAYETAVDDNLERLRDTWCNPSSPASMSILLSSTYSLLSSAAKQTNKFAPLSTLSRNLATINTSVPSREMYLPRTSLSLDCPPSTLLTIQTCFLLSKIF